ncbi:MAG TPA: HD domain-containing protein [Candidatus Saccharimonadales bacterium]|nr:HD domain-containing protein [Candidatus Saccharimonadales bacterium]
MFDESIETAKDLISHTDDMAHDINHIRCVAENAKLIGGLELYPDIKLLELCGWWHDVARGQGVGHEEVGATLARDDLLERGADKGIADTVYGAIRLHKTSMIPNTLDGNIIRDADKLDFISVDRWKACLKANQLKHLHEIKALLPDLRNKILRLDTSRHIYDQRITEFTNSEISSQI